MNKFKNDINLLVEDYIVTVARFYPGRADVWGILIENLGFYDTNHIQEFIKNIKVIRDKLLSLYDTEIDDSYGLLFIKNIDTRIFELEVLKEYETKCSFYVEKIFMTLQSSLEFSDDLNLNNKLFINRLKFLRESIIQAKKNLSNIQMGKLECICSINECKEVWKQIYSVGYKFIKIDHIQAFEEFILFCEYKADTAKDRIIPYDSGIFEELLKIYSGSDISVDYFFGLIQKQIIQQKDKDEKLNMNKTLLINDDLITSKMRFIYQLGREKFGDMPNLFDSIAFEEYNGKVKNCYQNIKTAAYNNRIFEINKELPSFIYNKIGIKNDISLMLKLIHEIYPGHHYLHYCTRHQHKDSLIHHISEELMYDEGWSKYCEYYYAKNLLIEMNCFDVITVEYHEMFILALVIFKIHYFHEPINNIINELITEENLELVMAQNMVITASLRPIEKLHYSLGFLLFNEIIGDKNIEAIYEHVINSGYSFEVLRRTIKNS